MIFPFQAAYLIPLPSDSYDEKIVTPKTGR
jgi:hypothetical protein